MGGEGGRELLKGEVWPQCLEQTAGKAKAWGMAQQAAWRPLEPHILEPLLPDDLPPVPPPQLPLWVPTWQKRDPPGPCVGPRTQI